MVAAVLEIAEVVDVVTDGSVEPHPARISARQESPVNTGRRFNTEAPSDQDEHGHGNRQEGRGREHGSSQLCRPLVEARKSFGRGDPP